MDGHKHRERSLNTKKAICPQPHLVQYSAGKTQRVLGFRGCQQEEQMNWITQISSKVTVSGVMGPLSKMTFNRDE